jgi:mannosyl-3-phosphoglycerate phosphatase
MRFVLPDCKEQTMPTLDDPLLVFSDVDGTLQDSHTGDWQPAAEWLARLREHRIP